MNLTRAHENAATEGGPRRWAEGRNSACQKSEGGVRALKDNFILIDSQHLLLADTIKLRALRRAKAQQVRVQLSEEVLSLAEQTSAG